MRARRRYVGKLFGSDDLTACNIFGVELRSISPEYRNHCADDYFRDSSPAWKILDMQRLWKIVREVAKSHAPCRTYDFRLKIDCVWHATPESNVLFFGQRFHRSTRLRLEKLSHVRNNNACHVKCFVFPRSHALTPKHACVAWIIMLKFSTRIRFLTRI